MGSRQVAAFGLRAGQVCRKGTPQGGGVKLADGQAANLARCNKKLPKGNTGTQALASREAWLIWANSLSPRMESNSARPITSRMS